MVTIGILFMVAYCCHATICSMLKGTGIIGTICSTTTVVLPLRPPSFSPLSCPVALSRQLPPSITIVVISTILVVGIFLVVMIVVRMMSVGAFVHTHTPLSFVLLSLFLLLFFFLFDIAVIAMIMAMSFGIPSSIPVHTHLCHDHHHNLHS